MKKQNWNNRKFSLLATLLVFPFLAACGGDDDDGGKKSTSNSSSGSGSSGGGQIVVCFALILVSGNDDCASSGSSSSSSGSSGGGTSGGTIIDPYTLSSSVQYVTNDEVEPNDDRSNANALNILTTWSPDGFIANGSVNGLTDTNDYYSMIRPSTRHFRFVLCADGSNLCNDYGEIDSLTAYIDVLDTSGSVIASSQAADRNLVEPLLDAGLLYYVRIVAGDTMGSSVAYQLTAHEFEPN